MGEFCLLYLLCMLPFSVPLTSLQLHSCNSCIAATAGAAGAVATGAAGMIGHFARTLPALLLKRPPAVTATSRPAKATATEPRNQSCSVTLLLPPAGSKAQCHYATVQYRSPMLKHHAVCT
jgi:hypothetical protein